MTNIRRWLSYLALWSPVALGFALAIALTRHVAWPEAFVAGTMSTLPAALLGVAVIRLCQRMPWRESARLAFMVVHAVAAAAFASLWATAILSQMWMAAPRQEVESFLREGFVWQIVTGVITYAVLIGATYARGAMEREAQQARAAERAEMLRLRAEMSALRARLDPHFLFNVLQTIGALARERPDQVHAALEHLAALLRRRIDAAGGDADDVSFATELTDARQYLALETLRFGDRLATSEDIDPATLSHMVPRFTLQPLVENAIRHGLAGRAGGGRLAVSSRANGKSWALTVRDDGVGADPARFTKGNGVGITVLRERLRLRFGDRAGLSVDTGAGAGCAVTVRLPIDADEPQ